MHPDIHKPSIDIRRQKHSRQKQQSLRYNQSKKKISYCKLFIYFLYTPLILKFSLFPTTTRIRNNNILSFLFLVNSPRTHDNQRQHVFFQKITLLFVSRLNMN